MHNPNQSFSHAKREFKPGDYVGPRVPRGRYYPMPGDMLTVVYTDGEFCNVEELRTLNRFRIKQFDLDPWELKK